MKGNEFSDLRRGLVVPAAAFDLALARFRWSWQQVARGELPAPFTSLEELQLWIITSDPILSAIETVGAMLRVERAGQVTATAAAIDSEETNASLKAVALGIKDSIEELFQHFARILGLGEDAGGEVVVNTDFGAPRGTDAGLNTLAALNMAGKLSDLRMLAELQSRGELSPDFDHEKNADELTLEVEAMPNSGANNYSPLHNP